MRAFWLIIFASTAFCLTPVQIDSIALPKGFDPIAISADGTGRFFLLSSGGRLVTLKRDSVSNAELDPSENSLDWLEPSDMSYSVGWLYIVDRAGGSIYMTDNNLRSPASVEMSNDGEVIRPAKLAVSTDGRILIWDENTAGLLLFDNWRDSSPTRLQMPRSAFPEVSDLTYDLSSKSFFASGSGRILEYGPLGNFTGNFPAPSPSEESVSLAVMTIDENLWIVDNKGIWSYSDGDWTLRLPMNAVIALATLRGRFAIVETGYLRIFELCEED